MDDIVIVGWSAAIILGERPDVLRIRIVAPLEDRAKRLADRNEISVDRARHECQRRDNQSEDYVRHYFNTHWGNPHLYHLVINMGALGFDMQKAMAAVKAVG